MSFKKFALTTALLLPLLCFAQTSPLMPMPHSTQWNDGRFRIKADLSAAFPSGDPVLEKAVNRFFQQLNSQTMAFFESEFFRPGNKGQLEIKPGKTVDLKQGIDESYTLEIREQKITITSSTNVGALRALETLLQLASRDELGYYFPAATINDKPAFPWRGLMIDVARHFIPMDVLKRNVDAMAAVKMNVLHLHLTDDEGFRMESKVFPKLHQRGSNGNYYTQQEMKELVSYARERGIIVIPEFDLPGHAQSWFAGYPELASAPGPYTPGPRFKVDRAITAGELMAMINTMPTPTIDPTKESVYAFFDRFMGEMKTIFPYAYMHIGADENNGIAWKKNPAIVSFMEKNKIKDVKALEHYFIKRMYALVQKHKLRMIVWEEAYNADLPKDVIVQKWKPDMGMMGGGLNANNVLQQGNDLLVSSGFYLDHHMPAQVYHLNPSVTNLKNIDTLKGKMLGGEAAQWSEIVDGETIETRMWMNTAAVAERLWSNPAQLDVDEMYGRLFSLSHLLDMRGLRHIDQYDKGIRRLAGSSDTEELKTLTDVLAPVKGYKRLFGLMTKPPAGRHSTAPLVRIADILPMNSEVKRLLRNEVKQYLANPAEASTVVLKKRLNGWVALKDLKLPESLSSLRPHADNLSMLATVALEAIEMRGKGTVPEDWQKGKLLLIKKAAGAIDETEIDILPELQALITGRLAPEPVSYPIF